jgi:hypothetical protein
MGEVKPMKHKRVASIAVMLSTLCGCGHVAADLRHPGGAIGGVLDNRMFDASSSKDLVLLRSAIMIAMVARAGTVYSRDQRDSEAYVNYIISAANEINIAAGHIRSPDAATSTGLACGLPPVATDKITAAAVAALPSDASNPNGVPTERPDGQGCYTYQVNFESDLPTLERRLFKVAMAALPQEQAKRFLDQVTKGDAIGAVIAAFNFSAKALDGLHSGAAVHRTGIEVVARQHIDCKKVEDFRTVYDASHCMGLPTDKLFVGKHDERGDYKVEVNSASFHALMRNLRDSCRMIPLGIDDDAADLNKERNERIADCNSIEFKPRARWS